MIIFPAIDLFNKNAVRLYKGDYNNMTVYSNEPLKIALDFQKSGATHIHVVDLEGAKNGNTPNIDIVKQIVNSTSLFVEVGGGIRDFETIKKYIEIGVNRIILGTSAVKDENLLKKAVEEFGEKIAVGVDIKDGYVAIKGWTEKTKYTCFDFCQKMLDLGVKTIICTDISKDGVMQGANLQLYQNLSKKFNVNFIASGGVSSIKDIENLAKLNLYGAIIGKAYYIGKIDIKKAIEVAKCWQKELFLA